MYVQQMESERKQKGLTQGQLASRIGLSDRAYRGYVAEERPMQIPFQSFVAKFLRAPHLALETLAQLEDNPFAPVVLDNPDNHPALEILVAVAELREALEALQQIDPLRPDPKVVERAVQQVMDFSNVAAPYALISFAEAWGVDLWAARQRHLGKLTVRGYLRKEGEAA